jgi:signal peptidase I
MVFEFPEDRSKDFIKRVIGVPGDVVEERRKKRSGKKKP